MLIYQCPDDDKVEETFKFKPKADSENSTVYDAPVPDFSVAKLNVKKGQKAKFPARKSASIVIVTDCQSGDFSAFHANGENYVKNGIVKKGLVIFLEANDTFEMTADGKEDIEAYQAFC